MEKVAEKTETYAKRSARLGKASKLLGAAGLGLTAADAYIQGEVEPSHIIGAGLFFTGVFISGPVIPIIGAVYFVTDIGLDLFTEKSLSDRIDEDWLETDIGKFRDEPLLQTEDRVKLKFMDR